MGNLTEEPGFNRVNDCDELKHYNNQIHTTNFPIFEVSKKKCYFSPKHKRPE